MNQPNKTITPSTPRSEMTFPDERNVLDISGFIRTLDFVPTAKPKGFSDQLFIVTAGASSRLYIYDTIGLAWKYTALT